MAIRPILVDKQSPFVGEHCALCKEPFAPGEDIILCPEDASRHHVYCWQAAGDRCSAYGCSGSGQPILRRPVAEEEADEGEAPRGRRVATTAAEPRSKVQTYPSASLSCAQGCLIVAIALSILLFAFSCFGLWAMLDFLFLEVLGWHYRAPLSGAPLSEAHALLPVLADFYFI